MRQPTLERTVDATTLSKQSAGMVASSRMGGRIQSSQIDEDKSRRGSRAGWRVQQKKAKRTGLSGIYNLSKVTLTQKETNILNAGLKCTTKPMNKFNIYIDIHKYVRKLNIKKKILSNNFNLRTKKTVETVGIDSGLKNRSLFNPPQPANHQVEVFKQLVLKDLNRLEPKKSLNLKTYYRRY